MASCPHCGAQTNPGASFCHACGTTLAATAPAAPAAAPASSAVPAGAPAPARPVGVTIVGVVLLVLAGFIALGSIVALFFVTMGLSFASAFAGSWLGAFAGGIAVVVAVALLVALGFAGFVMATGAGLLRGSGWAWTATLVLMGLNALRGLLGLADRDVGAVVTLLVSALVIWYFLRPEVKAWFGRAS